jgi:hypothetical protein
LYNRLQPVNSTLYDPNQQFGFHFKKIKFWEQEAFWVVNKISLELGD